MVFAETDIFQKEALASLSDDEFVELQFLLMEQPDKGVLIPGGHGLRKIRLAASGKGQRGGARVIYYWFTAEDKIWLMDLYFKSSQENLTARELPRLAKMLKEITNEKITV